MWTYLYHVFFVFLYIAHVSSVFYCLQIEREVCFRPIIVAHIRERLFHDSISTIDVFFLSLAYF
jgi:hypothetical protein